jgi:DNA-directed RNA polymerase subunit E'/Rpb7
MIENKTISVLLNLNPKYLHKDMIMIHIETLLEKNVLNYCFQGLGKVMRIGKIKSIGLGKIHIDTGFCKTPVIFEAEILIPKVDDTLKGIIEKYDSNGGVYINYRNMISVFCLNTNLNSLLKGRENKNKKKKENLKYNESAIEQNEEQTEENTQNNIGMEVTVKITKVNINEQNMIIIGKII